jgi:hypothetical protein
MVRRRILPDEDIESELICDTDSDEDSGSEEDENDCPDEQQSPPIQQQNMKWGFQSQANINIQAVTEVRSRMKRRI